jgi:predicted RNA binding protein YcfA (HicA-like mRNA interferase family)
VKHKELHRLLTKAGWVCKHGGNHDKYYHKDFSNVLIVQRHKEIPEPTARQTLKDAGLLK